jgi:hypothetical protein
MKQNFFAALFVLMLICTQSCTPSHKTSAYLLMVTDTINDRYGYIDQKGDTAIPLGKYEYCFTDTFRTFAIVHKKTGGYFAIDRNEKELYEVFNFDNGPDYAEEGLFRIIKNGKIGYADAATGEVVIKPQYECAYPFENGAAQVSVKCKQTPEGEYEKWESEKWIYIDKKGTIVNKPAENDLSPGAFYDATLFSVLDSAIGDLNLDSYPDKLLILKSNEEGIATDVPRPLLILAGQPDNTYQLIARNDSVVLTANDGGIMGDPYLGMTIKKGFFSIEHYGGSSWRWSRVITFKYSKEDNTWRLHRDAGESYHSSDPDKTTDIISNKEDYGKLSFENFRNRKGF